MEYFLGDNPIINLSSFLGTLIMYTRPLKRKNWLSCCSELGLVSSSWDPEHWKALEVKADTPRGLGTQVGTGFSSGCLSHPVEYPQPGKTDLPFQLWSLTPTPSRPSSPPEGRVPNVNVGEGRTAWGPAVPAGTLMDLCRLRQHYSSLPTSIRIPEVLHVQSKKTDGLFGHLWPYGVTFSHDSHVKCYARTEVMGCNGNTLRRSQDAQRLAPQIRTPCGHHTSGTSIPVGYKNSELPQPQLKLPQTLSHCSWDRCLPLPLWPGLCARHLLCSLLPV